MDDVQRALHGLRDAAARAGGIRPRLSSEYLALIHQVEELPENRSGADKSQRVRRLSTAWPGPTAGPLNPDE